MAFTQKLLSFSFSMAAGTAGAAGGGNSANVSTSQASGSASGLRASVHIEIVGGQSSGTAVAAIFGLPLSLMNQLTTLGTQINSQGKNTVQIMAGDSDGMTLVFSGNMWDCYMDGSAQPRVPLRFRAVSDGTLRLMPGTPTTVKGTADVATLMGQLAQNMGLQFENNNVNVKISNPYLHGSWRIQAAQLAQHAGIQHLVDRGKLSIWNAGQSRQGDTPLIAKSTGMIAYPRFSSQQLIVSTLFLPTIECGQRFQVQSDITAACGQWETRMIVHDLESFVPKGKWETTLYGNPVATQVSS